MNIKTLLGLSTAAALAVMTSTAMAATTATSNSPSASSNPYYTQFSTGYAFSRKAGIQRPTQIIAGNAWATTKQGYNANLGDSPFYALGFGREVTNYLRLGLDFTHYSTFHYQKFQTVAGAGPLVGPRTRFFDLDNQSLLVNATLHAPKGKFTFKVRRISISPFIGFGIGLGINQISNFHTIIGSTGGSISVGDKKTTTSFAWQGSVGLTLHPTDSHSSLDLAYRYYDGGTFYSSTNFMESTGRITLAAWKGHLKTNQVVATYRYSL